MCSHLELSFRTLMNTRMPQMYISGYSGSWVRNVNHSVKLRPRGFMDTAKSLPSDSTRSSLDTKTTSHGPVGSTGTFVLEHTPSVLHTQDAALNAGQMIMEF